MFCVSSGGLLPAAGHYIVATAPGQRVGQRRFGIEAFAMLVERRHFDVSAEPDSAAIGWIGAGEHIDQRGLAGTVRPDDADPVAALHADRKIIDDAAIAISPADVFGFDDQLAGLVGFGGGEVGVAGGAAI